MNILLRASFPDNLVSATLVAQQQIPCFCMVSEKVEIKISSPLPEVSGVVEGLSWEKIDERAPPGAGGEYAHYCFATITIEACGQDVFKLTQLSFFNVEFGWCDIVKDGDLTPPGDFWDEEPEYLK